MSSPCMIPSNPDIAGIGVRAALYVQNLLCFVPAIWAIWDGEVSDYELDSTDGYSTTNLFLAFAILISCIVEASTGGLANYHASIVLSISWMNNTSVFVYFLLYVQHEGQDPQFAGKRSDPVHWIKHIVRQVRGALQFPEGERKMCSHSLTKVLTSHLYVRRIDNRKRCMVLTAI